MDLLVRVLTATSWMAFACVLVESGPLHAQIFSPGALSKPHENLEGLTNCVKCHEPGNRFGNALCTKCHTEIKARVDGDKGFHGRVGKGELCATCHREHKGLKAKIIDWGAAGKRAFDHARTGTPLRGAHRPLDCKECHVSKRIVDDKIHELVKKRGRRETFLGLDPECKACHFDEHRGQLGQNCTRCHVEDSFKPARRFVHNRMADFKLSGKHKRVRCTKCHSSSVDETTSTDAFPAPVSSRVTRYEDIPHSRCIDCHDDKHHKGKMGRSCEKCHVTDGWDRLKDLSNDIAFHEKTKFPLRGEHIDVDCKSCHGPFAGDKEPTWKGLPFEKCSDCHMDAHLATIVDDKGATPDCQSCHTVERFMPALFSVDRHSTTRFALEGSHRAVDCKLCHIPMKNTEKLVSAEVAADRRRRDRPIQTSAFPMDITSDLSRCESCHKDPHDGQFPDVMQAKGCVSCHQATRFAAITFDHDTQSRFPLLGKHKDADCRRCHVPDETVVYRGVSMVCADCHRDVHVGQFAIDGAIVDCARCHDERAFTPSRFSHDDTAFTDYRLKGVHRALECARCHLPVDVGQEKPSVKYRGTPRTCAECHVDQHEGRFNEFVP
jgi:hypothetical protein